METERLFIVAHQKQNLAQLGALVGDHITHKGSTGYRGEELVRGKGYAPPAGPTDNVKAVGVGGGRTVYGCGSQDQHGQPAQGNPQAAGRDVLSQFGPESSRPRGES
jgi:hypothetical protein